MSPRYWLEVRIYDHWYVSSFHNVKPSTWRSAVNHQFHLALQADRHYCTSNGAAPLHYRVVAP